MIFGHATAPFTPVWTPPAWTYWLPLIVMPFALILVVGAFSQPNPTVAFQADALRAEDPAPGMLTVTRHPILWGAALFCLAHIPPNGDLASLMLFGPVLLLALGGTIAIDRRYARTYGAAWDRYARLTSNLPLLALITRRTHFSWREVGVLPPLAALAAFLVLLWLHDKVIGVVPLPPL